MSELTNYRTVTNTSALIFVDIIDLQEFRKLVRHRNQIPNMSDCQAYQDQIYGQSASSLGAITTILSRLNLGQREAFDDLVPLVYHELRRIAQAYLRRESKHHTLQPTALIHEAYMRLAQSKTDYENRKHFYAIAARVMRQILVDHARARSASKRDAGITIALDQSCDSAQERNRLLISLDDALNTLSQEDERKARLVEMRFFGGLTAEESAEALAIPVTEVRRHLRVGQAWLQRELDKNRGEGGD